MISPGRRSVVVVGAGIQGLLAALMLRERGFDVHIHSAGADPRLGGITRSSTSDGEAIRLITPLEGCPYVGNAADSPEIAGVFEKPYSQGGWLGRAIASDDAAWLYSRQAAWNDRDRVAKTLAGYIETSRRSMAMWQSLHASRPELFTGVDWQSRGVIRLYDDAHAAAASAGVHRELGALQETLTPQQLAAIPTVGGVGGGFRIHGFALHIKRFVTNLIHHLERDGVQFNWTSECQRLVFDKTNLIKGLEFINGIRQADHFVLTTGAYTGPGLLRSLGVTVSGLAGRWLLLPKPAGSDLPTKVHFGPRLTADGPRPVLDLNLMAYFDTARQQDMLAIGGGYLHVGGYPFQYDEAEMRLVDADIDAAVRRLMPSVYAEAEAAGTLIRSTATCVRSITADDRPAVAHFRTDHGGSLIFHSGLNTGTTTLAPAIAADIAAVISGESGPESLLF